MLCYFAEIILGRVQQRHVSMASQRLEWSKQGVVRIADTTKCDKWGDAISHGKIINNPPQFSTFVTQLNSVPREETEKQWGLVAWRR